MIGGYTPILRTPKMIVYDNQTTRDRATLFVNEHSYCWNGILWHTLIAELSWALQESNIVEWEDAAHHPSTASNSELMGIPSDLCTASQAPLTTSQLFQRQLLLKAVDWSSRKYRGCKQLQPLYNNNDDIYNFDTTANNETIRLKTTGNICCTAPQHHGEASTHSRSPQNWDRNSNTMPSFRSLVSHGATMVYQQPNFWISRVPARAKWQSESHLFGKVWLQAWDTHLGSVTQQTWPESRC